MANNGRLFLFATIITLAALLNGGYLVTALGLGLFTFVLFDFVKKIGKTIPILEALLLISCLQWILGPYIDYVTKYKHYKYYMYVPEQTYMNLVVPSLFLFALPLYYFSSRIDYAFYLQRIRRIKISDRTAMALVVAGFASDVIGRFAPGSLGFVFFLASGIKFVGLLYLFYSNSKRKWIFFWVDNFCSIIGRCRWRIVPCVIAVDGIHDDFYLGALSDFFYQEIAFSLTGFHCHVCASINKSGVQGNDVGA